MGSNPRFFPPPQGTSIPNSVRSFADRAQLIQKRQVQFLFESFLRHMWVYYTAVLYWKSQSPWPVLRGALYAYDLMPTGGYYGATTALTRCVRESVTERKGGKER